MLRAAPQSRFARLALCLALSASTAAAGPPPATLPADLQSWVEQLNAPDPADRLAAERRLSAAGTRAVPTLSAAVDDPRPEVAARARRALRQIRLFTLRTGADLDAALTLANRYLSTDAREAREAIAQQLAALQPRPTDVIVRLFLLEPDDGLRARLLALANGSYRGAAARLVAELDAQALEPLLEHAANELWFGASDYAVERHLTGHWDDAVARWKAELVNGDAPHQALAATVLCALYRVADKTDDAAEMAKLTQDWRTILSTAFDRGDWPAAAAAAAGFPAGKGLAVRAALGVLAGASPANQLPVIDADALNADPESIGIGRVRLLLGDVDGGLARLSLDPAEGGDPVAAFRLRQARGEFDAALALAVRFARDPKFGPAVVALRDDLRRLLGDLPGTPTSRRPAPDVDPVWTAAVADLSAHRFAEAAAALAPGDGDPARLDWWYVRGHALAAAGDAERGQSLIRAATLAPLADTAVRAHLADRLSAAGLDGPAAEQRTLAARLASPFADPSALLDLNLSRESAATAAHDYPAAVAAAQRVWLLGFWPDLTWRQPLPYLTVPADVHLARARAARATDDWPTAMRELGAYGTFLPTSADVPLEWVPLLDARGDHAAADGLFATAYDALDGQSARHPRSVYLHNQSAWLAACCCRRLDAALAHAEAAVRLSSDDWQFTDTLAEVRFRLGDRTAALDLERRAAALNGADTAYVARQLARFAKADVPSTTRPADAPD